ncbi:hypothetical protein F2Q68_00026015 [Brassica cretica]|uniref:Uncharacterized protein n=1 Tax=Brassica cretica TaxID=69181 RepID=A0A8S9I7X2_BRACR|nr:hypothetical protein F2Q68_00026015 [Brassica cretica]
MMWWFDYDRDDFQEFLRSKNVRIVSWKLWEHLEILGGSIVFVVWDVIYDQSFQVGMAISVSLRFPNTQIEVTEVISSSFTSLKTISGVNSCLRMSFGETRSLNAS